jgi:hypothetical protein
MNLDPEEVKNIIKNDEILNKLDENSINEFIKSMEELSPEDIKNYIQYQKTLLSMGFPSCRIMMGALLKHAPSDHLETREHFLEIIDKTTSVEKVGGMNIEYTDIESGQKTYCYILMNKCNKDHDLVRQLDKIQNYFDEEKWKEILKNISMLLYLCKNMYKLTLKTCNDSIFQLGLDINEVDELKIDESNMTLFIDEDWDERVGIYIMRECELVVGESATTPMEAEAPTPTPIAENEGADVIGEDAEAPTPTPMEAEAPTPTSMEAEAPTPTSMVMTPTPMTAADAN